MSTKIWIGDKMYVVDEPVREYVDELQAELATAKEENRWIPVGELPPRSKSYHHSLWYVLTDGKDWTIGYYDFPFETWSTGHSPFDLSMAAITHYRSPTLLEGD